MILFFMQMTPNEQNEYRKAKLPAQLEALVRALARNAARERFIETKLTRDEPGRLQDLR